MAVPNVAVPMFGCEYRNAVTALPVREEPSTEIADESLREWTRHLVVGLIGYRLTSCAALRRPYRATRRGIGGNARLRPCSSQRLHDVCLDRAYRRSGGRVAPPHGALMNTPITGIISAIVGTLKISSALAVSQVAGCAKRNALRAVVVISPPQSRLRLRLPRWHRWRDRRSPAARFGGCLRMVLLDRRSRSRSPCACDSMSAFARRPPSARSRRPIEQRRRAFSRLVVADEHDDRRVGPQAGDLAGWSAARARRGC